STANAAALSGTPYGSAEFLENGHMDPLFQATVQATEEAIVNAIIAAKDMVGEGGRYAKAIPHAELVRLLKEYGRYAKPD
ncbi:P1 family peptidase, partial [Reyranella sp.]|uniref:P1 family peptidase n=1 Tax=Reyranella sp. TaxID=1929291 RepID=UPI003D11AD28